MTAQHRAAVFTWDYREQPNLGHLANLVRHLSDGRVHLVPIDDTGSDQYAIVLATTPLDPDEAQAVFDRWDAEDDPVDDSFPLHPDGPGLTTDPRRPANTT